MLSTITFNPCVVQSEIDKRAKHPLKCGEDYPGNLRRPI